MKKDNTILIAKYLSGNASEAEQDQMEQWLQDPSNQNEFEQIKKLWQHTVHLKQETESDVDAAWSEFRALAQEQPEARIFSLYNIQIKPLSIAAGVALFVSSFFLVKFFISENNEKMAPVVLAENIPVRPIKPTEPEVIINEIFDTVKEPEQKTVRHARPRRKEEIVKMLTISTGDSAGVFALPDNSIVYLNVNSKLSYPEKFASYERKLTLEGEAYFDVKPDDKIPFVVLCQNSLTRVVGTTFNIKGYNPAKEVEVIVLSGMVEFSANSYSNEVPKILLAAGDVGVYYPMQESVSKFKNNKKEKDFKWWKKAGFLQKIKIFLGKLAGNKQD
jgi:transmembrane sensor